MDNVQQCLPKADHTAISNVQLFLQISFLSKKLIPADYSSTTCAARQSQSIRIYTQMAQPATIKTDSVETLATGHSGNVSAHRLILPLKEWTKNTFNTDWQWE